MAKIAALIDEALLHRDAPEALARVGHRVGELAEQFPLYPELR